MISFFEDKSKLDSKAILLKERSHDDEVSLSTSLNTNLKSCYGYLSGGTDNIVEKFNELENIALKHTEKSLMDKLVIVPGIEKNECLPYYKISRRQRRRINSIERSKSAGEGWFNLVRAENTKHMTNLLTLLKMRNALDTKRFYKKADGKDFPKYCQIGTVVDAPCDYYTDRLSKKQKKKTLVEELLDDTEFKKKLKKRYLQTLQTNSYYIKQKIKRQRKLRQERRKERKKQEKAVESEKQRSLKGANKHAKRLKKNKK